MIERLMNPEKSYGEPEYSKMAKQITRLRWMIEEQLSPEGKALVEQLSDIYIRQGNAMLSDAFIDGFCTAIELVMEFQQRRS